MPSEKVLARKGEGSKQVILTIKAAYAGFSIQYTVTQGGKVICGPTSVESAAWNAFNNAST